MTYPTTLVESLAVLDADIELASGDGTLIGNNQTFDRVGQMVFCCNTGTDVAASGLVINIYQSTGTDWSDIAAGLAAGTIKIIADKTATLTGPAQAVINVKAEELDNDGGFVNVAYRAVADATADTFGVVVFGGDAKYGPASDENVANTTVVK